MAMQRWLLDMDRYRLQAILTTIMVAIMASAGAFSATLRLGSPSVVVTAGQTVEIPVSSSRPIVGDLTAHGAFEGDDVTFTPGPGCHLSAHGCTLLIKASPTSKDYTAVPVVVSESAATNTPVFALSVIYPGASAPLHAQLPKVVAKPIRLSSEIGSTVVIRVTNTTHDVLNHLSAVQLPVGLTSTSCSNVLPGETCSLTVGVNSTPKTGFFVVAIGSDQGVLVDRILNISAPTVSSKPINADSVTFDATPHLQRSGSALFYAIAEPHLGLSAALNSTPNDFTANTNGPAYQIIRLTNKGANRPLSVAITGAGAQHFRLATHRPDFGSNQNCSEKNRIASGESCLVIVKGKVGDPREAPQTAILTINGGPNEAARFKLTTTTYVYAAGGFNTLGNASVSGGNLLVQCTAGTCANTLQGTSGNNYASQNASVGSWINALTVTPSGNLIVGGVFGAIGGATSGATSGTAALLAQCKTGAVTGNACINQISSPNPYAFNNAYIDGLAFSSGTSSYIYVGGDFSNIRITSVTPNKLLARCAYNGVSSSGTCANYFSGTSSNYANNTIVALDYLTNALNVGGLFTQVKGYPSPPTSGTTFASCTTSSCSQGMDEDNPNGSILGISDDVTSLYMGGAFTQIGGYTDTNGGYPLVSCTLASICTNALSGSNDANGYIEGLAYSGGNLYVGGQFTTIGGATPVSGGYMLAVCTPGGGCSNFVTDAQPYASGPDWGGAIFAVAVGSQTSIAAF